MKTPVASAGTVVAGIAVRACARSDMKRRLTWLRAEGTPATHAELQAAKDECLASVPADPASTHPRLERQAYGQKVLQCVQGKGYQLVDEDTPQ